MRNDNSSLKIDRNAKQRTKHKIVCASSKDLNFMRISVLLYPIWGLLGPLALASALSSSYFPSGAGGIFAYLSLPMYLFFGINTLRLLRKHIMISPEGFSFPGLDLRNYSTKSLVNTSMKERKLQFEFAGKRGRKRTKSISLDKISSADRIKLIEKLDELKFPAAHLNESDRRKFLQYGEEELSISADDIIAMPYDSHAKIRAFAEICAQYEKVFWSVWIVCCVPLTISMSPTVFAVPYLIYHKFILGHKNASAAFLNSSELWPSYLRTVTEGVSNSMNAYYHWMNDSASNSATVIIASLLFGILAAKVILKPNRLILNKNGLELRTHIGFIQIRNSSTLWQNVKNIKLVRRKKTEKITERKLVLESKSNKQFALSLEALQKEERRTLLMKAIELWAPQSDIESGILESLSPSKRHSYTELWLQSLNSPPKRERLQPLKKGDRLQSGKYTVLDLLGSGGQGVAYVVETIGKDSKIETFVLKEFMLPIYVDRRARSQAIERFEKETQVLSALDQESIVKLNDHFIEDHRAYLVLEHIKGKSLRKLVETDSHIGEEQAQNLVLQMCEILNYLHERENPIVHRDFTPDNLILNDCGILKLIDFNVVHHSSNNRTSATIVGKHAYMPAEQFAGRPCPQSDLYALGASIYFLLTGKDPEAFTQSFLPADRPDLHPRWSEIISRCTTHELPDRVQSAREVALMIECLLEPKKFKSGDSIHAEDQLEQIAVKL